MRISRPGIIAAFVLAVAGLLPAASALAQDPSGRIIDIDDSDFPNVRVVVSILDPSGRPVLGLDPSAFSAVETGAAASIAALTTELDPELRLAVILTIDVSGSMAGAAIQQARNAASAFVSSLDPGDQAAVLSFGNQVVVEQDLTADRDAARAAIGRLQALGNTALYGAVAESVARARESPLTRRAIVLLSDGQDFGGVSTIGRAESLDLAADAHIPIYAIGLGASIDRAYLTELAGASGGAFLEAPTPDRVAEIYQHISELLRSQYVVTLRSTAPADIEDRSVSLRVQTPAGPVELSAEYRTRRTILPTPTPVPAIIDPISDEGGGSLLFLLVGAFVGLVAVAGASGLFVQQRKRRQLQAELAAMALRASRDLAREGGADEGAMLPPFPIRLTIVRGEGTGQSQQLGAEPLRVGSGPECQLKLQESPQVAPEHVRVWWRSGRLMFHRVANKPANVGGADVDWAVLEIGDTIEIGPYRLVVEADR
jgi:VWFA-related protein